jgi:hypothetical protein
VRRRLRGGSHACRFRVLSIHCGRVPPDAILRGGVFKIVLATFVAAIAALLVLAGDGNAGRAAAAANTVTFPDSSGEDPQAPDVTSVVAANDDRGNLTFTINIPNRPTLTPDMFLLLAIDADANPASGSPDFLGADYVIELDGPLQGQAGVALFRWNGSDFTATGVSQSSLVFSYTNGATIRINSSELGSTRRFSFGIIAVSGLVIGPTGEPDFANIHVDNAPDPGHGFYTYDVRLTPPSLVVRSSGARPLQPSAGKLYTRFAVVGRSDNAPVQAGSATCRATIAGKALRATSAGFAGGRATCTFRIPRTAKGKTIRITITVRSQGLAVTRSFSARIR